ncbi:MAG: DUF1800 domain-containing protein [Candidatus Rokubacteria bacterium]|nr:DUF1800 domain-containing protein [Candidatus Rokubacteria bacterium]
MTARSRAAALAIAVSAVIAAGIPASAQDDRAIVHLLARTTFGPRPGDVARVRELGAAAWLETQLHPERLDDTACDTALVPLATLRMSIPELLREYPRPDQRGREQMQREKRPERIVAELQAARMIRAVTSQRQLHEVMVDFWFNHFNVFAPKGAVRWYVTDYERTVVRPHALGRFPDLVRASARHPAMLFYLDNWISRAGRLNENYARELLELHTLGVDGGYTQTDVTEVARAFTGWGIERPQQDGWFVFRPRVHDYGEKIVLGHRLAAGRGQDDGERVLDLVTRHPATARFIATKLVRRFVSDTPPPALVAQIAEVFRRTDGDVKAMLRAIFASGEFTAADAERAKIKKPLEFVASAVRAIGGGVDARGGVQLARAAAEIGEPLYGAQPPTGWPDRAGAWVSAGTLLARMNFGLALAEGRVPGVRATVAGLVAGVDAADAAAVRDRLVGALLNGHVSAATRAVLDAHLTDPAITRLTADDRGPVRTDIEKVAALVLGSPEFQRR